MPFDAMSGIELPDCKSSLFSRLKEYLFKTEPFKTEPTPFTKIKVLVMAQALIADEKNWIQKQYESTDGRRCAIGAFRAIGKRPEFSSAGQEVAEGFLALLKIAHDRGFSDIEKMNDNSSHSEVMSAFAEAIYSLKNS